MKPALTNLPMAVAATSILDAGDASLLIYSVHSMVSWMQSLACLISTLTLSSPPELDLGPNLKPTVSRKRYLVLCRSFLIPLGSRPRSPKSIRVELWDGKEICGPVRLVQVAQMQANRDTGSGWDSKEALTTG